MTQYLIRKLLDMVKMGIEGLAVAALLISVKAFQKLKIYYINRALSKLNCYALYLALDARNRILACAQSKRIHNLKIRSKFHTNDSDICVWFW